MLDSQCRNKQFGRTHGARKCSHLYDNHAPWHIGFLAPHIRGQAPSRSGLPTDLASVEPTFWHAFRQWSQHWAAARTLGNTSARLPLVAEVPRCMGRHPRSHSCASPNLRLSTHVRTLLRYSTHRCRMGRWCQRGPRCGPIQRVEKCVQPASQVRHLMAQANGVHDRTLSNNARMAEHCTPTEQTR